MSPRSLTEFSRSSFGIPLAATWLLFATSLAGQLTDLGNSLLDECDGVPETCEIDDAFGSALAAGDFNHDGFADLAVGVVGESVSGQASAGAIHIFYGSPGGLQLTGDQVFTQASAGIAGSPEAGDQWGAVLAAGFFNGDEFQDLAVGAPLEDLVVAGTNHPDAGAVWVLFGSAAGLTGSGSLYFDQNQLPCCHTESIEDFDRFGSVLIVQPAFGGATTDGLVIGAPDEDGLFTNEGVVHVLTQLSGVPLNATQEIRQSAFFSACGELGEINDRFGAALAYGEFNGFAALAIGAPTEEIALVPGAGRVAVEFYSGSASQCWDQNSPGILDVVGSFDEFSAALVGGDFDGDGFDDLAVGVPGEDNDGTPANPGKGIVQVLYGSGSGLSAIGDQLFDQDDFAPNAGAEAGDRFGAVLAAGDFDGDGADDLAIGVPDEGVVVAGLNRAAAGMVNVLYGVDGGVGLGTAGNQTFHQDFPAGMLGVPGTNDRLGQALASGDFDGNGTADLAIGIPGDTPGVTHAGRVQVLYGLDGATGAFGAVSFASAAVTFPEDPGTRIVFLSRSGSAVTSASVDHARTGGSATPGVDFNYTSGSESWGVGDFGPEFFGIQVLDDTLDEPDETIVLQLSNPSPGTAIGTPATLTVTIQDNDVGGSLQFSASTYSVGEAAGPATITVTRTGGAASAVTVHYETFEAGGGTATPNQDYTPVTGTFTFGANESSKTFQVPILNDPTDEPNETIALKLATPGGGGILGSPATAMLTILDDDLPPQPIFVDGFESGNSGAWSLTVGVP